MQQREIGAWVMDEAHCLSKWGHDFRPDYRYVGRFIRERAEGGAIPPVLCLTATAKPEVKEEIVDYFWQKLGIEMRVFDGGSRRTNLEFVVVESSGANKFHDIHMMLTHHLPPDTAGGAIVYCATRRRTEEVADFLTAQGVSADRFHAGLPPEEKKNIQQSFIRGELQAMAATNAFGMGIDKPDVRLVIHADEGISTDMLMEASGLNPEQVRAALYDLERLGIASNDTELTAFVHVGVRRPSRNRLTEAVRVEQELIDLMREMAPDTSTARPPAVGAPS